MENQEIARQDAATSIYRRLMIAIETAGSHPHIKPIAAMINISESSSKISLDNAPKVASAPYGGLLFLNQSVKA